MTLMVTKFVSESNIKNKKRERIFTLIRLTINNPHFVLGLQLNSVFLYVATLYGDYYSLT